MGKNVAWLDASVDDIRVMKFFETLKYIISDRPN